MRVALVSTHRSDKGHYARLERLLQSDSRFEVILPPRGEHPMGSPWSTPDVAVVLGDRAEMLQTAILYVVEGIPLIHIHGGEHTYGSLDERWRYAITAIADWHCVAHEMAKWDVERYLITGEWGAGPRKRFTDTYRKTANCVVVTGAPGLDDIRERQPVITDVRIIVHYNPVMDATTTRQEWAAICEAMMSPGPPAVVIVPNGDRFSDDIEIPVRVKGEWAQDVYRDGLAAAHVIVGNSSAGIIEAPSLGTWSVNVGERQAGRVRAGNVIDVPADPVKIREAIEFALGQPRYTGPNPYEHPQRRACEAIRDVILGMGGGKS